MEELLLGGQLPLLAVLVLEQGLLERLKRLETPVDVVLCFLTKKKKCSAMKIIFRLHAPNYSLCPGALHYAPNSFS